MTESEWLAARTPRELFPALREAATPRKARLYACACCRAIWDRLSDERSRQAVQAAEDHADVKLSDAQLQSVYRAALNAYHDLSRAQSAASSFALAAAECARPTFQVGGQVDLTLTLGHAVAVYAANLRGNIPVELLHELFGNPFQPVQFVPEWISEESASLARQMYEAGDFSRMVRLGELLRSAGCTSTSVLMHCRQKGHHVRGCWVVDAILMQR